MISHDIHVHTKLSLCAKEDALPASYIDMCAGEGIKLLGFSDHFWDETVPGEPTDFYRKQDLAHVLGLAGMLPDEAERKGVKVLFGVECEFLGGDRASVSQKVAERFDFILVPPDHFHMAGFTRPADLTDTDGIRALMVERFNEAAALRFPVPFSIAHPFVGMGYPDDQLYEVIAGIPEATLRDSFGRAAENGAAIELQSGVPSSIAKDARYEAVYLAMYDIAKSQGCRFTFGTDAHTPSSFGRHDALAAFADKCGIGDGDAPDFVKAALKTA